MLNVIIEVFCYITVTLLAWNIAKKISKIVNKD